MAAGQAARDLPVQLQTLCMSFHLRAVYAAIDFEQAYICCSDAAKRRRRSLQGKHANTSAIVGCWSENNLPAHVYAGKGTMMRPLP